jgi:hypothetical protein
MLATDDLVGRVIQTVADRGQLDNTIFVFSGDNGMEFGEHRINGKDSPYATEIPFYLWWPGTLGNTPTTVGQQVQNIDLAPTLCEIAGCTLGPYPNGQAAPDGISFYETLRSGYPTGRTAVLDEHPSAVGAPIWYALRTSADSPWAATGCAAADVAACRWQYTEYPKSGEVELYDVSGGPCWTWVLGQAGDPCEMSNLLVPKPAGKANGWTSPTMNLTSVAATGATFDPTTIVGVVGELHAMLAALEAEGAPVIKPPVSHTRTRR